MTPPEVVRADIRRNYAGLPQAQFRPFLADPEALLDSLGPGAKGAEVELFLEGHRRRGGRRSTSSRPSTTSNPACLPTFARSPA